jgi:peroxiredoxin
MRRRHAISIAGAFVALMSLGVASAKNEVRTVAGQWDATVVVNSVEVPFRFDISGEGRDVKGSFVNGDQKVTSTRGTLDNGVLTLVFDQYATRLNATLKDGQLEGQYERSRGPYPFRAVRHTQSERTTADVPSIAGIWRIPVKSPKGESAWRFIVRQTNADVSAAILRVDGDTGTLTGTYGDGKFVLGHFSGARPLRLEVMPSSDGTLELVQNGQTKLTAVREDAPRASEVGEPTDPAKHTRVKDPAEKFRFSFPDLNGRLVSDADPRFQGKVVLVSITGSWCPNCHDEAPFLASLYRKYRGQGFEVVALSFEESEQLTNPTRLRAFIKEYGLEYTFLLAGEPEQLAEKVPQAENLNAFPTTFILGRDGRVRAVHAGFPSSASGKFYADAQREVSEQIERLLREKISD